MAVVAQGTASHWVSCILHTRRCSQRLLSLVLLLVLLAENNTCPLLQLLLLLLTLP